MQLSNVEEVWDTTLRLISAQLQATSTIHGATKYGRDHGPAQEASSNPILVLNDHGSAT